MTLDDRLRAASDALRHQVPTHLAPPNDLHPVSHHHGRRVVLAIVLAVALVTAGLAIARFERTAPETVTSDTATTVRYEKVAYSQQAHLTCQDQPLPAGKRFNTARFEAWADTKTDRYRMTVTYPNGQQRDVIAFGNPWYPTALYIHGDLLGANLGCTDRAVGILVAEPGQSTFFSLNPLTDVPVINGTGQPAVNSYTNGATKVPGEHHDSRGRTAVLWQQVINGTTGGSVQHTIHQTTSTYVDPATGDILERNFQNVVDDIGSASWTETHLTSGQQGVPAGFFDTKGYTKLPETPSTTAPSSPSGEPQVLPRCPNTTQAFENAAVANESADALPEAGTATQANAQAALADVQKRYGATSTKVVPVAGRAYRRAADGSITIIADEIWTILVTIPHRSDCPAQPVMFNGVPLLFQNQQSP